MPQRRLSINRATALGPVAFLGALGGMPRGRQQADCSQKHFSHKSIKIDLRHAEEGENRRRRGKAEEELKRSRQKLTERSANYEWIFSQLEGFTPFYLPQPPPPLTFSHIISIMNRSTGNYLASETELPSVWFMQRCATVFLPLGLV